MTSVLHLADVGTFFKVVGFDCICTGAFTNTTKEKRGKKHGKENKIKKNT